jgi:hypothetical protein
MLERILRLVGRFARKYLAERNEPNIPDDDKLVVIRMANSLRKSADHV